MKRIRLVLVFFAALGMATAAKAAPVTTLTFAGLADQEPIANYYAGGLGGLGSGPGPNYGITFTPDQSIAVVSALAGGSGNFEHNPTGSTVAYFLAAAPVMNVSGGFNTQLTLTYCDPFVSPLVTIYSGPDGTANALGLAASSRNPDPRRRYYYDNWQTVSLAFNGTGESVVFSGPSDPNGLNDVFGLGGVSLLLGPAATPSPSRSPTTIIWQAAAP